MIQELEKILKENWGSFFSDKAVSDKFYFILKRRLHSYQIFIFAGKDKFPICIMKTPLEDKNECIVNEINLVSMKSEDLFQNELSFLLKLEKINLGESSIPRILYQGEIANRKIALQSILPGLNMIDYTSQGNLKKHASIVLEWLIRFHKKTEQSNLVFDQANTRDFLASFKKDEDLATLAIGNSVPLVAVHGDFRVDNFLIDRNKLIVLDWERSKFASFGLFDLFFYWARQGRLICDTRSERPDKDPCITTKSFIATFFKGNKISAMAEENILFYCNAFNIKPEATRFIFLLWLIEFWDNPLLMRIFLEKKKDFLC
jgi:hypothetical protein